MQSNSSSISFAIKFAWLPVSLVCGEKVWFKKYLEVVTPEGLYLSGEYNPDETIQGQISYIVAQHEVKAFDVATKEVRDGN